MGVPVVVFAVGMFVAETSITEGAVVTTLEVGAIVGDPVVGLGEGAPGVTVGAPVVGLVLDFDGSQITPIRGRCTSGRTFLGQHK